MKDNLRKIVYRTGLVAEGLVENFLDLDIVPKLFIVGGAVAAVAIGNVATRPARVENKTDKMMDSEVYFYGVDEAKPDTFYEVKDSYGTEYVVPKSKIVDALDRKYKNTDINKHSYSIHFDSSVYLIYDENREIKVLNAQEIDKDNEFAYVYVPVSLELNPDETIEDLGVIKRNPPEDGSRLEKGHKGYIVEDNNKEYYIEKYELLKEYNNSLLKNTRCEFSDGQEGKWDNLNYKLTGKKTLTIHKEY